MVDDLTRIVRGTYSIYRFTDQIYKIVKFKNTEVPLKIERGECTHYDSKLDNSISRTKRLLLEKALCNPWDWFCTLTIDKRKYDRHNLGTYYSALSQWLRDYRKKGYRIQYLLVPELHKDDAWHIHGFFHGLPQLQSFRSLRELGHKVPDYLVYSDFYNWPEYQQKFGFCSFGRIKSPVRSAFYISKYITKDHASMVTSLNAKMFYSSQGLNKAMQHGEVYGSSDFLDTFLQQEYQYCSVGMTKVSNQCNWTFGFNLEGFEFLNEMQPLIDSPPPESSDFVAAMAVLNEEYEQLSFGSNASAFD